MKTIVKTFLHGTGGCRRGTPRIGVSRVEFSLPWSQFPPGVVSPLPVPAQEKLISSLFHAHLHLGQSHVDTMCTVEVIRRDL